jgi:FtsH-binding integral membrane protein
MDLQQKQTYAGEGESVAYNASFHKLMRMFTLSVLISFLGTVIGTQLPPAIFLPLIFVELIMLVASFFIQRRGKAIGYGFVYTFCLISGITIYPVVAHYASAFGAQMVMQAFILTVAMFAGLSLYGYYSKRDFSFLSGFLTVGIIALIGVSVIQMFVGGFGGTLGLVISFAGIMIFSGFILYDISQFRHGLEDKMIPLAVLGLYLSFINLFLYLLRFLGILQDD